MRVSACTQRKALGSPTTSRTGSIQYKCDVQVDAGIADEKGDEDDVSWKPAQCLTSPVRLCRQVAELAGVHKGWLIDEGETRQQQRNEDEGAVSQLSVRVETVVSSNDVECGMDGNQDDGDVAGFDGGGQEEAADLAEGGR